MKSTKYIQNKELKKLQKKEKKETSKNNIWNKEDFHMYSLFEKNKAHAWFKHINRCLYWSWQRVTRGYADCDVMSMYAFLQHLLPEMLQDLKNNRVGSPAVLGKEYTNEDGILMNDTCHKEWDQILEEMIFLWKESGEETCTRVNIYEEEYFRAWKEFEDKYGIFGEKLQTKEEQEENQRRGGGCTVHFMREIPDYKEIDEKYSSEQRKIEKYREECKDKALDLLKEYFFALWD